MRRIAILIVCLTLLVISFASPMDFLEDQLVQSNSGRLAAAIKSSTIGDNSDIEQDHDFDDSHNSHDLGISLYQQTIVQGEPAWIVIDSVNSISEIASLTFAGKPLTVFMHEGKPSAIIGIDLRAKVGTFPLRLTLTDGRVSEKKIVVVKRETETVEFHIPTNLGGDTKDSENQLITTLAQEAALINSIASSKDKLWNGEFIYPVANPVITDEYGYTRHTGTSNIPHKGTDFRAPVGTAVYAMNSGVVAFTDNLRNHGKTIVIDHGMGIQTLYLHLSEIMVKTGEFVRKGQEIGRSGETGYVFGPHLHLSVRIGGVSIDPMEFMGVLGVESE